MARLRSRLMQIKVRQVVVIGLGTFFIYLIYSHNTWTDESQFSKEHVEHNPIEGVKGRRSVKESLGENLEAPPLNKDNGENEEDFYQNQRKQKERDLDAIFEEKSNKVNIKRKDVKIENKKNEVNSNSKAQKNIEKQRNVEIDNKKGYEVDMVEGTNQLNKDFRKPKPPELAFEDIVENDKNLPYNLPDGKRNKIERESKDMYNYYNNEERRAPPAEIMEERSRMKNNEPRKRNLEKHPEEAEIYSVLHRDFEVPEDFFTKNISGMVRMRGPNPQKDPQGEPRQRHGPELNKELIDPSKDLHVQFINKDTENLVHYKKDEPLIWVTGHPRSGTTLMRAMLDAHPSVRCGEETHVIPRMLAQHGAMAQSRMQMTRLVEANINQEVINNALGAYIMTVIAQHGEAASRLCNKDPMTITNSEMIMNIFPSSKFIFMIRDGRAVVNSIIRRKVGIQGFDRSSYSGGMKSWNMIMTRMYHNCQQLGPSVCLPVYYEQLVLHPQSEMKKILDFMNIPWDDKVLRHEQTIGKSGGVSLSKKEFSTDQVEKPVNIHSITSWVKNFPIQARESIRRDAPLLELLGYDPDSYPPFYGEPDPEVVKNSELVDKMNEKIQERKRSKSGEEIQEPPEYINQAMAQQKIAKVPPKPRRSMRAENLPLYESQRRGGNYEFYDI